MNLGRKFFGFAQFILVIFVLTFSANAAGEVDPTFNPRFIDVDYVFYSESIERTNVRRVVVQPDGKILAAGLFNVVNNSVRDNIVRFNADGTLDTGFNPPALARFSGSEWLIITALALQTDGKILIGGNFITTGTARRSYLARLNTDGSLDSSFNANQTGQSLSGTVVDIEISADGKITVCGDIGAVGQQEVVRILSDGSIDSSFSPQINTSNSTGALDVFVQPDGKTLVSIRNTNGTSLMYRLNADGSVDFSHLINGSSYVINRIVVQPDGKILLGGSFTQIDGFPVPQGLLRLNSNGMVDTTFNFGNSGAGGSINDVELLLNGKILIGGSFGSYNDITRQYVAVLNSDGSLDNSFNYTPGRVLGAYDLAVQADGKIVVATYADFSQGALVPPIARLNADATLDSSIQPFMGSAGFIYKVLVQPDGKILIAGFYNHINSVFRRNLARFSADGTTDPSFTNSIFFTNPTSLLRNLDLQPDGKILAAGGITNGERLNPDGSHDVTLNSSPGSSILYDLPDGKILGLTDRTQRFSASGFLEAEPTRFNFGGAPFRAGIQTDGKIIVVGSFTEVNFSAPRGRIARLNPDATFDATFDTPGGGANNTINDVVLQSDGKIIIAGLFTSVNSNSNYKYLARLNADGSLDTSFNPILNASVTCLKLQPDGKILFSGAMTTVNGVPRNSVARVNPNGTLDASFNLGSGADGLVRSIDVQTDGKILIGGEFRRVDGVERLGVARLLNTAVPQPKLFDFDGDGKADVSVFRPSENRWYVFRSSDSVVAQQVFAIADDIPVPADYDGDGKTDFAIFRPGSGDWWSLSSASGAQVYAHWGANGDIPRPSDFDGDGRADYVVFRPSNSFWYRISSANGASSSAAFGLAGDKPVTGDFDGDGKSDKAIFRPSTGDWWYQSSINNAQLAVHWGISTDIPAPADFDGDGRTDFAVYRPSTGVWYIINSSNFSFTIMNFGIAEDKPVPADYDGDGKADIAVFRPSTGIWYQMRSTQGFSAQQFGISSDVPTPNAFVP